MKNVRAPGMMDPSDRLADISVLVADRDARTASLVTAVLRAFGFRLIELATDAEQVLHALTKRPYGLIITEWHLATEDGITLVKAVRQAKKDRILRRDIPIIMLTARSDVEAVRNARDAGITEFLAKPFSARTLSHRMIQVIDNPRIFIDALDYSGPCRRRRGEPPPGEGERRGARKATHDTFPPNYDLSEMLGEITAAEIFTEQLVNRAQEQLQKQEAVFIDWANDDVLQLEKSYTELVADPRNVMAREVMVRAAYAIKSQAGIFGYDLGTQVAGSLVDYLENHPQLTGEKMTVLRKHIDTVAVIFHQKIKDAGRHIGAELIDSLHKLVAKLG